MHCRNFSAAFLVSGECCSQYHLIWGGTLINFSNICASKMFLFGSGQEKLSYCYSLYFRCLGHTHTLIFIWRQETFPMFIYKFGFHYGRVCSVGNHKVFINNLWKWGLRLIGHCQTIYKQTGKGNTKPFIGTAH